MPEQTLLEKARAAVEDLVKAQGAGVDVQKEVPVLQNAVAQAQLVEIAKSMQSMQKDIQELRKAEEDGPPSGEGGKKVTPNTANNDVKIAKAEASVGGEPELDKEGKKVSTNTANNDASISKEELAKEARLDQELSEVLDLALEEILALRGEITRLSKAEDKDEKDDKPEFLKDKKDEDEDEKEDKEDKEDAGPVEKMEDGPTAKLQKPGSADYTDSKEGQNISKSEVVNLLKRLGYNASTTPVPEMVASRDLGGGTAEMDLAKAVDKLMTLGGPTDFHVINKFREQVDPAFRSISLTQQWARGGR